VCDEGAYRVALGAGLEEGRTVHTTGPREEDESFSGVDAILAVFARATRHLAGARVGWGIEATVVEGVARSAEIEHDVWIGSVWTGNKDSWDELPRIHFDGFLEKTDQ